MLIMPVLLGLHWHKTDRMSEIRNVKCYRNTQIHSWRVARALTGENKRQQRRQVWFGSSPLQQQVVVGWPTIPQILITSSSYSSLVSTLMMFWLSSRLTRFSHLVSSSNCKSRQNRNSNLLDSNKRIIFWYSNDCKTDLRVSVVG